MALKGKVQKKPRRKSPGQQQAQGREHEDASSREWLSTLLCLLIILSRPQVHELLGSENFLSLHSWQQNSI